MKEKKIYDLFIFAGEHSGDLHGEGLLRALYAKRAQLRICGVGGPKMRSVGMDVIVPMEKFQVMGFVDVFIAMPKLFYRFYQIAHAILEKKPSVAVFIDYPGFNLRMEKHLRKKGFTGKIIHYICPSVWAWGKKRIPLIEKTVDALLCILPSEKRLFSPSFPVHYCGNPLVDRIRNMQYQDLHFPPQKKVVALFPGSRKKEIERNFPLYAKLMKELLSQTEDFLFAISLSEKKFTSLLLSYLSKEGLSTGENIVFVDRSQSYDLMHCCHMAIAKSGTVTLELALHGAPTVVTYGVSSLDLFIALRILKIYLPYYSLPNILMGKEVFAELIGPNFTFDKLSCAVHALLYNDSTRSTCMQDCRQIKQILGDKEASSEAASHILSFLDMTSTDVMDF